MSGELWGQHPDTADDETHLWTRTGTINSEPAYEPRCGAGDGRMKRNRLGHLMVTQKESISGSFCEDCRDAADL